MWYDPPSSLLFFLSADNLIQCECSKERLNRSIASNTIWINRNTLSIFFLFSPAKNTELVRQQHTIRCAMCVFCLSANAEYPNPCIHLHTVLSTHELFIDSMNEIKIHTFRSSCMWSSLHWRRNNSYCDITRACVCAASRNDIPHPMNGPKTRRKWYDVWARIVYSLLWICVALKQVQILSMKSSSH